LENLSCVISQDAISIPHIFQSIEDQLLHRHRKADDKLSRRSRSSAQQWRDIYGLFDPEQGRSARQMWILFP